MVQYIYIYTCAKKKQLFSLLCKYQRYSKSNNGNEKQSKVTKNQNTHANIS